MCEGKEVVERVSEAERLRELARMVGATAEGVKNTARSVRELVFGPWSEACDGQDREAKEKPLGILSEIGLDLSAILVCLREAQEHLAKLQEELR